MDRLTESHTYTSTDTHDLK